MPTVNVDGLSSPTRLLSTFPAHWIHQPMFLWSCNVSFPCGHILGSASDDKTAALWDTHPIPSQEIMHKKSEMMQKDRYGTQGFPITNFFQCPPKLQNTSPSEVFLACLRLICFKTNMCLIISITKMQVRGKKRIKLSHTIHASVSQFLQNF